MTGFEIYVFILCMIVLVSLTAVFTAMIALIYRKMKRLIRHGLEDRKIAKEYRDSLLKVKTKKDWIYDIIFFVVFGTLFLSFLFSITANVSESFFADKMPAVRVVRTASMAEKHKKNEYLFENDLNNQLEAFDLVITNPLPDEMDLKLYDIVVYDVDGMLVLHRIVGIQEPNAIHPNERWFILQGDAVENPDRFPVYYHQMKAIYTGVRVPFIGSFILFMQSPAGYICMLLVVLEMISMPIVEKWLEKEKEIRLKRIFVKPIYSYEDVDIIEKQYEYKE